MNEFWSTLIRYVIALVYSFLIKRYKCLLSIIFEYHFQYSKRAGWDTWYFIYRAISLTTVFYVYLDTHLPRSLLLGHGIKVNDLLGKFYTKAMYFEPILRRV